MFCDERNGCGFDEVLWKSVVEFGWFGILFLEDYGGFGFGYVELGIVFEELGKRFVNLLILFSIVMGGGIVVLGGIIE